MLQKFQGGDSHSGWLFVEHKKIVAIIRGRLRQFRNMFVTLCQEDLDDVQSGLRPRILEIAKKFNLDGVDYDGKIVSYFSLRIRGEADHLLKKITGMKQVNDKETNKTYLKSLSQTIDGFEEFMPCDTDVGNEVIVKIEDVRQSELLSQYINSIPEHSNDKIWLQCYFMRLAGKTWSQVAQAVGFKQTDNAHLKDNTARFITRLKDHLISMGEEISYRICGIYTDDSEVSICVFDSNDRKKNIIWSKCYETYSDLERVEFKLGDLFRQHEITYVIMNEQDRESRSTCIIMRYLTKREAFVESVHLKPFISQLSSMPKLVNGVVANQFQKRAYLLTHIKRALLEINSKYIKLNK